jgi:fructosamine-3-kinase
MDLKYLREHPAHLPTFLFHQRIRETPVTGGSICQARRLTLEDGNSVFAKSREGAPKGFFTAEAEGLRWLAPYVPVPEVIAALPEILALSWLDEGSPSPALAEQLGRDLAALHQAGAPHFGAEWPGFIGSLPTDNTPFDGPWHEWFTERRLRPLLRISVDGGALERSDVASIERVFPSSDFVGAPARLHGDLWPGNVLWGADRAWLVDPAAHGGHRETDLANLRLFGGLPYLDRLLGSYNEVWPLADGWEERVPVHQLYLLLAHTAMFGASYRSSVLATVQACGGAARRLD